MEPEIYYTFQARLISKKKDDGEFEFIEVSKKFLDNEPIIARKAAFRYYQNYIDVLLQAKGAVYESDKQARELISSFWDPGTSTEFTIGNKVTLLPDSFGNGIGVFFCTDNPFGELEGSGMNLMIHGIGSLMEGDSSPEGLMYALTIEYNHYKHYNYSSEYQEINVVFCDSNEWKEGYQDDEPQTYTILRTPFDWTGLEKALWWQTKILTDSTEKITSTSNRLGNLIAKGESNQIEFKPAMLHNFITGDGSKSMKELIAKTICAFLNSNGGFLFIGVEDDGKLAGLASDFALAGEREPKDFFRLQFDNLLKQFLPSWAKHNINADFQTIEGQEVFIVTVFPSTTQPVFLKNKEIKEFYVRWTASSMRYKDIEEIVKYCLERWRKK